MSSTDSQADILCHKQKDLFALLKDTIKKQSQLLAESEKMLQQSQSDLQSLNKELKNYQDDIRSRDGEMESFLDDMLQLSESNVALNAKNDLLTQKLSIANDELKLYEAKEKMSEDLMIKCDRLKGIIRQLNDENCRLKDDNEKLQEELRDAAISNIKLMDEKRRVKAKEIRDGRVLYQKVEELRAANDKVRQLTVKVDNLEYKLRSKEVNYLKLQLEKDERFQEMNLPLRETSFTSDTSVQCSFD